MRPFLSLLRVKQWVKNLFVFTPIIFSRHLLHPEYVQNTILAFLAFCFISSSIYIINDIFDRDLDKLHPIKKNRPIASGKISITNAIYFLSVLIIFEIIIIFTFRNYFGVIILLYFLLNVIYTIWVKHIVILDVFSIASGFMLRVIGGAVVIDVMASSWLIICTLFVSLFLGFAKRRSEMVLFLNQPESITRKVLNDYSIGFIDQMLIINAAGMAISYSLYTVSERTVKEFHTENLIYTTIFVLFGIFRFLYLLMKKNQGEDAASVLLSDLSTITNIIFWLISCVLILYFKNIF